MQQKLLLLNQVKAIRRGLTDTKFFARYWLGIELNPFQERVCAKLDEAIWGGQFNMEDLIEMLMNAGNRTGKTVLIAIIHIKFAYYKIGILPGEGYDEFKYRTFDISPMTRQAKECLKYIEDILEGRLTWVVDGKRYSNHDTLKLRNFYESKNENIGELRYRNNSVTYAFSTGEDMGRGFQGLPAGIVTYDECVLSHHLEDELDSNVYSRLGDYGKLMMLVATPNEDAKSQQYFHHLVMEARAGNNKFIVLGGNYEENIFISEEKRKSHVQTIKDRDPIMAEQILHGDFVSTGGTMFETAIVEQMWNGKKDPKAPHPDHEYLISVDWGVADKGDETVMIVWDVSQIPIEIVYVYGKQGGDPYELMATLRNLKIDYNEASIIMDTSSMGGAMFRKLLRDLKPISFEAGGTGDAKEKALFYAQALLTKNRNKQYKDGKIIELNPNYGWIKSFYVSKLANQLANYRLDDKKLKQDWVSSFYIGCYQIWKKFGETGRQQKSFRLSPFKTQINPNGLVIKV